MRRFSREWIFVELDGDRVPIQGSHLDGLAVVEVLGQWTVTHEPTGLRIFPRHNEGRISRREAFRLCRLLLELGDWTGDAEAVAWHKDRAFTIWNAEGGVKPPPHTRQETA